MYRKYYKTFQVLWLVCIKRVAVQVGFKIRNYLSERNTGKAYQFRAETAMTKSNNYPNGIRLQ
jgi:uncharacterized protein YwbE